MRVEYLAASSQIEAPSLFEKSGGGVRPSRAQQRGHFWRTQKVHATRPSNLAASGDGRTPFRIVATAKASFQTGPKSPVAAS